MLFMVNLKESRDVVSFDTSQKQFVNANLYFNFKIRTDTFQIVMMIVGLLASIIQGSIDFGGIDKVFEANRRNGRIEFFE